MFKWSVKTSNAIYSNKMAFITLLSLILSTWLGESPLNTMKSKPELEKQEMTNRGRHKQKLSLRRKEITMLA